MSAMREPAAHQPQRIQSVDVLRGFTVALMILVNDPGDWSHIFRQLDHAEWNGWTLTDLVFPTFLFLVGASVVFSTSARIAKGDCRATLTGHVFWRALKIFLVKEALSLYPHFHWTHMRIYGVLTRIALCYLCAALIVLATWNARLRAMWWALIAAALLVGYWVLMRFIPVPGCGMPTHDVQLLDPNCNLAAWIDRGISSWTLLWLHTGRLYETTRDPEGLLSTLPAVASTLLGACAGAWMQRAARSRPVLAKMQMLIAGAVLFLGGEVWSRWLPINKKLWTPSYVLLAAGLAAIALSAVAFAIDDRAKPWPRWLRAMTWPWLIFGSNAIAAFVISEFIVETALWIRVARSGGMRISLWGLAYRDVFAVHGSTQWTSLEFAVCYVGLCFLPLWWMWRKRWFVKL